MRKDQVEQGQSCGAYALHMRQDTVCHVIHYVNAREDPQYGLLLAVLCCECEDFTMLCKHTRLNHWTYVKIVYNEARISCFGSRRSCPWLRVFFCALKFRIEKVPLRLEEDTTLCFEWILSKF